MAVRGNTRRSVPLWKQRRAQVIAAVVAVVVVAGAAAAFALGGGDDEPEAGGTATTERTAKPGPGGPIAPLTGLVDKSGDSATRAAIAVKIDNVNLLARPPQEGLDVADVVYEEPVEFATRFLALFHSQAPLRVGPVRSTRFIDPAIMWPLPGSMYVYSGGTPDKIAAIEEAPVTTIDENGLVARNAQIRDPNIEKPHNLFAVPGALWDTADDDTLPQPLFLYGKASNAGEPVVGVDIPNDSQAHYDWDAATRTWKRSQLLGGSRNPSMQPHVSAAGVQFAPTNLVVQRINSVDNRDAMLGEGDAWVFTNGRVIRGRWQRSALEDRTAFVDASGREIRLQPGTTWVHLITGGEPGISPAAP